MGDVEGDLLVSGAHPDIGGTGVDDDDVGAALGDELGRDDGLEIFHAGDGSGEGGREGVEVELYVHRVGFL